jgi:hypothetical protein
MNQSRWFIFVDSGKIIDGMHIGTRATADNFRSKIRELSRKAWVRFFSGIER